MESLLEEEMEMEEELLYQFCFLVVPVRTGSMGKSKWIGKIWYDKMTHEEYKIWKVHLHICLKSQII